MRNFSIILIAIAGLLLPGRLFAAPAAPPATQPSKEAAERADSMKANLDTFTLSLNYTGPEDKPYYRLFLSVPEFPPVKRNVLLKIDAFQQKVRITEAEAKKIVDRLAIDGFLDHALGDDRAATPAVTTGPLYTLKVTTGAQFRTSSYEQYLPFDAALFKQLDSLRTALNGAAAKAMDTLLDRLSGDRKEIEKADKK